MEFSIDRESDTPVWRQIRGTIEYAIACGELAIGDALPSVRELAEQLAVAPMTISQVYGELKREGLVEARTGSGTYVADSVRAQMAMRPETDSLHQRIDGLIDYARSIGIPDSALSSLVSRRVAQHGVAGQRTRIVIIGLFSEAVARYARRVAGQLGDIVDVQPMTLDTLERNAEARATTGLADLIVTFANLRVQIAEMFPGTRVAALRFIPSEDIRLRLASLEPMARVAVVSRFVNFLPIIRTGVMRFAPHVRDVVVMNEDDPALVENLADRDVIVYATGADAVAEHAPIGAQIFEYSHIPDPGDVDRYVRPFVRKAALPNNPTGKGSHEDIGHELADGR